MKTLTDQLAQYATYHRDRRNIATHLVGIPMILLALQVLLSRPVLADAGVPVTPALILTAITALYYQRLDRPLGALMALLMAAGLALAAFVYGLIRLGAHAALALGYPYGMDYGEGVIWQQMIRILDGGGYAPLQSLPAFVFQYPPLYHLTTAFSALLMEPA